MKNAQPVPKNQPGVSTSLSESDYTTIRAILAKAAPWLVLQMLFVLALTLSVGGVQ